MENTKIGIKRGNSYQKNEEVSRWKAQIHTRKFNWYILTLTEVFPNQKRINVCEHTVTWYHLYWVFIYIYSLLIDKQIFESQNISIKFLCALLVYLCISSRDFFSFSVRVPPFYPYFGVFLTSVLSFSTWSLFKMFNC